MKTIGVALLVVLSPWVTLAQSDPAVTVTSGQIRGAPLQKGGAVFKGIPYAQPPVGELRWREPMPVQPWSGVRDAKEFGAMCAQRPSAIVPANVARSEDCLFLNVWTSEWPGKSPKPVMVWIPGGGNFAGGSSSSTVDGERLARRGVVVVTLNYRLGAFGFFSHPALTRESRHHASGNQGILDQIAALKWVKDNIKTPAGASIEALRAVPVAAILDAEPDYTAGGNIATVFPNLGITVDGYVFPGKPAAVFAAGQQHRVALLLGNNAREQVPGSSPPNDLSNAIAGMYGPLAPRAETLYVGTADPSYGTLAEQWGTDTSFRCGAVQQLIWHARARHTSYEYEFARVPSGREALGSTHASEVSHVFGTLDRGVIGVGPPARATDVDFQISEVMQRYWTTFAKAGDPNDGKLPKWQPFDVVSRAYIQFTDAGPIAKEGLRRPFCDLFIQNVARLMKQ
jgi:para-nitrobenzyl esterase